ncbi:hypothetical protein KUCAC02_031388 [Chaenocephalus aceratus]|nr:hypothetical protein KUCAC02_031388 [Chaenocephalus aceratus]
MTVPPEVRALEGYPVVLPCTFSHPQHSQHTSLQLLWRLGHGQGASVLFRCTSRTGTPAASRAPSRTSAPSPSLLQLLLRSSLCGRRAASSLGSPPCCRVQGSPPPDVQWLGTEGSMLEGAMLEGAMLEGAHPLTQGSKECFHTVSQLRDVSPGQQYTCSASNPLGKDKAVLYVLPPDPMWAGPLLPCCSCCALLLLLGGVWAVHGVRCWRK